MSLRSVTENSMAMKQMIKASERKRSMIWYLLLPAIFRMPTSLERFRDVAMLMLIKFTAAISNMKSAIPTKTLAYTGLLMLLMPPSAMPPPDDTWLRCMSVND